MLDLQTDGCHCITTKNKGPISLEEIRRLFSECPEDCACFQLVSIPNEIEPEKEVHILLLPACVDLKLKARSST